MLQHTEEAIAESLKSVEFKYEEKKVEREDREIEDNLITGGFILQNMLTHPIVRQMTHTGISTRNIYINYGGD